MNVADVLYFEEHTNEAKLKEKCVENMFLLLLLS